MRTSLDKGKKIAEVIESSSAEFTAQCYKLGQSPPLGSLVKTRDNSDGIYGVVCNVETHSLDPGRRVLARGENLESEGDIFKANPQLTRLLITDFKVIVVGHIWGNNLCHYLPPNPAPIHSFVYACRTEEVKKFTQSLDFLSLLVDIRLSIPVDDVAAACLRYASQAHSDPQAFLVKAGKELACLLSNDTRRLNSLLKRLK